MAAGILALPRVRDPAPRHVHIFVDKLYFRNFSLFIVGVPRAGKYKFVTSVI
jgi:hypothetical protein